MVSRIVRCRSGRSRPPPVSSGSRFSKRDSKDASGSALTGGGKLDGQREPVQPATDHGDDRRVLVVDDEALPYRLRAVDEEPHRLRLGHFLHRRTLVVLHEPERKHHAFALARNPEPNPTGDQYLETGTSSQQRRDVWSLDDVFEVVEH